MSDDLVTEFFEYLVSSVEDNGDSVGNPLFLMASLQYIVKNNLHGTSLNELMYKQHTRRIKELFFRLARNKTDTPESTWRTITNPRNPEMQNLLRQFVTDHGDVSMAFSKLKPSKAKELLEVFKEQLADQSSVDISA
jgi:hypothetical protein